MRMSDLNWKLPESLIDEPVDEDSSIGPYANLQAGMIVETRNGEQYVIGDVNELGGVCDCCRELMRENPTEHIKRWAWLPFFE